MAYVDLEEHDPFWALTRDDDIMAVERAPAAWVNVPRPALGGPRRNTEKPVDMPVRTLVQMDAPDHTAYRKISVEWFKQANVARLSDRAANWPSARLTTWPTLVVSATSSGTSR